MYKISLKIIVLLKKKCIILWNLYNKQNSKIIKIFVFNISFWICLYKNVLIVRYKDIRIAIRNFEWRRIFVVVNTSLFSVLDFLQRSVIVISSSLSNASSSREIYTQFACIIPWKWSIQWMSYTKSPIFVQQRIKA